MADNSTHFVTRLLHEWREGDDRALDQLIPAVQSTLRQLAAGYLRRERPDHTLQPTALVNEAYLRIVDRQGISWQDRAHFVAVAATVMRHVLVDHARAHRAAKRGAGAARVTFDEMRHADRHKDVDVLALDEALDKLAAMDVRQSRVVELRFFGGLSVKETAEVLEISPATVKREWSTAKAWLYREIRKSESEPD